LVQVGAFYFISLLTTTQRPTIIPRTDLGKIVASIIAFVSVGAVLSSIVFIFGPLFGTIFKIRIDYVEKEEGRLRPRKENEATNI
jgi:hypothetical protein